MVTITPEILEGWMAQALEQARLAAKRGEVPVGAVLVHNGDIIARAGNQVEELGDATAHAEMLCIREASRNIKNWRLEDSILVVTLEPCTMCIGALRLSRVPVIVFGAADPTLGAVGSLYNLAIDHRLGAVPRVIEGVKAAECSQILKDFFQSVRQ